MSNCIQTFYLDPASVSNAEHVALTSVDLYFRSKPQSTYNASGIATPGITVYICSVINGVVRADLRLGSIGRLAYEAIQTSSDASAVTKIAFNQPVVVDPAANYGIVIQTDDPGYVLWTNKTGDRLVGTNDPSVGSTENRTGSYYQLAGDLATAVTDVVLKFGLNVAKFEPGNVDIDLVNQAYEFFTVSGAVGSFVGGEAVFSNTSMLAGTVQVTAGNTEIIGSGTTFTTFNIDDTLVIKSGNTYNTRSVAYVTNNTHLVVQQKPNITNASATHTNAVVGKVSNYEPLSGRLFLSQSTATANNKFLAGQLVRGEFSNATATIASIDAIPVDKFVAQLSSTTSTTGSLAVSYDIAYANGSSYVVDNTFETLTSGQLIDISNKPNVLLSRSIEVGTAGIYNTHSVVARVSINTTHPFAAPIIDIPNSDITVSKYEVSNTYTSTFANSVVYDSEVFNTGVAKTRHLTAKIVFDNDRQAEDLKVYLSAYRPQGTQIRVYAKLQAASDQEAFDDKLWTLMTLGGPNANRLSSAANTQDFFELEASLPTTLDAVNTLPGSYTASSNSAVITTTTDPGSLTAGEYVRVYNELFPSNFIVGTVASSNTSSITLNQPITSAAVLGSGLKVDRLLYGRTAFRNPLNSNISRYLDETGGIHDYFNVAQVKIVLLADNTRTVPKVDQLEVIGVSA